MSRRITITLSDTDYERITAFSLRHSDAIYWNLSYLFAMSTREYIENHSIAAEKSLTNVKTVPVVNSHNKETERMPILPDIIAKWPAKIPEKTQPVKLEPCMPGYMITSGGNISNIDDGVDDSFMT